MLSRPLLAAGATAPSCAAAFTYVEVLQLSWADVAAVLPECRRFEATVTSFQMGEHEVPKGLERCVGTMRKGETCELICRAEYAYGDAGRPPDVPPGASVRYELELISFVEPKRERFELSPEEVYERALKLKAEGTTAFGSGLWLEAQVHQHQHEHRMSIGRA